MGRSDIFQGNSRQTLSSKWITETEVNYRALTVTHMSWGFFDVNIMLQFVNGN